MEWTEDFDVSDLLEMSRFPDSPGPWFRVTSSEPGERFYDAWGRSWEKIYGMSWAEWLGYDPLALGDDSFYWWIRVADEDNQLLRSGPNRTVGEMQAFIGDSHRSLRLGWGLGGADPLPLFLVSLYGLVTAGLTVRDILELAKGGRERVDAAVYKHERSLFEDWRDTDQIPMELQQAVRRENDWRPEEFCRVFGSSDDQMSRLLRALDYRPERDEWGNRHWLDSTD